MRFAARTLLPCCALVSASCVTAEPCDYSAYLEHMPRSILVLPPANDSVEVDAPYSWLSAASRPLAERGYYVLPVAVVDAVMKANGVTVPAEMHAVPIEKLREVFGADAVLYPKIVRWGTEYQVLNSSTTVGVTATLVDARTGMLLWSGSHTAVENSSDGQNSLAAMLVTALVQQIVDTTADRAHDLAGPAAGRWFADSHRGLLLGPLHRGFDADQERIRAAGVR